MNSLTATSIYLVPIIGIVVAFVTSLVKRENWSLKAKHTTSIATSVVAGLIYGLISNKGHLSDHQLTPLITTIYASAQVFYALILKGTTVNEILSSIGSYKGIVFHHDPAVTDSNVNVIPAQAVVAEAPAVLTEPAAPSEPAAENPAV